MRLRLFAVIQRFRQRMVSMALRCASHRPFRPVFRQIRKNTVAIFLLHRMDQPEDGILGHRSSDLDAMIRLLRRCRFPFVSMKDIVAAVRGEGDLPPEAVAFTMDDGYWDQAEIAAPLFATHACPLSIFLITGFVDGKLWPWDARVAHAFNVIDEPELVIPFGSGRICYDISDPVRRRQSRQDFQEICKAVSDPTRQALLESLYEAANLEFSEQPPPSFRPMTWDQARLLEKSGVTFGSHSVSHRVLSKLPEEEARAEIGMSQKRLRDELSDPVPAIAWPIGLRADFGPREERLAADEGYVLSLSALDGLSAVGQPELPDVGGRPHRLRRYGAGYSADDVLMKALGCSHLAQLTRRNKADAPRTEIHIWKNPRVWMRSRFQNRRTMLRVLMAWFSFILGGYTQQARVDWKRVRRLVFVCRGNICRSPYAEERATEMGFAATSCGLSANGTAPADPAAFRIALKRGVDLRSHVSRRITDIQARSEDLFLAAQPDQIAPLVAHCRATGAQVALAGLVGGGRRPYISDPYGGSDEFFEACFSSIDVAVDRIARELRSCETTH